LRYWGSSGVLGHVVEATPGGVGGERHHASVPLSEDEIEEEFACALADAGLSPDHVRFYRLPGLPSEDAHAAWFRPYFDIRADDRTFPDDAQRAEANRWESAELHRIAVPAAPIESPMFAAVVRHELEHACQWEAHVGIPECHEFIRGIVLPEIALGLDGCAGALVNSMPTEIDCNAAASLYIAKRFSADEVQAIRDGPQSQLACALLPPPPPDTLPARMIAFAFVHRAAVERHAARSGATVGAILTLAHPQAPALWARLEAGLENDDGPP
jgi:hypothetical protein